MESVCPGFPRFATTRGSGRAAAGTREPQGAAARAEGFDCILMEAEPAYCDDIRARLGLAGVSVSDAIPSLAVALDPAVAQLLGGSDPVADLVG